jgi:hypothetical protein
MSIVSGSTFTGEKYIQVDLPDYEAEYRQLTILLWIAGIIFVLFLIVVPRIFSIVESYEITTTTVQLIPPNESSREKKETTKTTTSTQKGNQYNKNDTTNETIVVKNIRIRKVPFYARWISRLGMILTLFGMYQIIIRSPYNRYLLRRAFVVPIMTEDECAQIITIADKVALRNIQKANATLIEYEKYYQDYEEDAEYKESIELLQSPLGWQKLRHGTLC